MTMTQQQSTWDTNQGVSAPAIDEGIRTRVNDVIVEQNAFIKERQEVIRGIWVARIAQLHVLMLGPGGTGKSLLSRNTAEHIDGAVHFEVALDETTDPSQVFGPPDIKAMVEDGKTRRIPTGMLPEATDGFIDEFFNANGPLLHSLQPILNERLFHNNGFPTECPLRQIIAGTNKLNADADQAALWDRIHLRYVVDYVKDRQAQMDMVGDAITRMLLSGRGTNTSVPGLERTLVTLDELDQAHREALSLDIPDATFETFVDIRDELKNGGAKIVISDRRFVDGMAAVMANAWLRGHTSVEVADLDILSSMWWTVQDQVSSAREVILGATNPGEKAALDLLDQLDGFKKEVTEALATDDDPVRKKKVGVESLRNADKLIADANELLAKAQASGTSTERVVEVIAKTNGFKGLVGKEFFGLDASQITNLSGPGA